MTFKHFNLHEFFSTCNPYEIREALHSIEVTNNIFTWLDLLEKIRIKNGNYPILINSCYRSKEHNKQVGGSPSSQHLVAGACDIVTLYDMEKLLDAVLQWQDYLGQVIVYYQADFKAKTNRIRFIHIALPCDKYPVFHLSQDGYHQF